MNLKTQRNILAVAVVILLIVLGVGIGTGALSGAAGGQGKGQGIPGGAKGLTKDDKGNIIVDEETLALDPASPGTSAVGDGIIYQGVVIEQSAGHDVVYSVENTYPAAFGGNKSDASSVANGCSIPGGIIFDAGAPGDLTLRSRRHSYTFTFSGGSAVGKFSMGVLDWGDWLPNGACTNGTCGIVMTAYNAAGEVVASSEKTFTSTSSAASRRETNEYGNLVTSGDACGAGTGYQNPGRFILTVTGPSITRVTIAPTNDGSLDPGMALWTGGMEVTYAEGTGTQGYWRNHAEAWPVSSITVGGTTYNIADAIALMDQAGKGDKTYDLFAQYVAAYLNTMAGNDDSCIKADLQAAATWFDSNPVGSSVDADSEAWGQISTTHDNLDQYNNGLLCAPHRD